jgi:membrane fusion protein, copper/silver efflux system
MRKFAPIAILIPLIIVAFIIGFQSGRGSRHAPPASGPSSPQALASIVSGESETAGDSPGAISVDARRRQLIGIPVGAVEKAPFACALRVLGRVAVDDTRLYIINAATSGWVMHIEPVTPGSLVKKDEVLASFYAPELLGAQQAFLYGLNTLDRLKEQAMPPGQLSSAELSIAQNRDQLTNLGMGDTQIEEIARTRERAQQVRMVSPTTGIIIYRNIFPGLKFVQGQEFFRIADLSRVWILADIFEGEDKFLRPGLKAKVTLASQKLSFEATVSSILPLFDPESRTLKVRLEAVNPGYALRPDMFVDVEVPVQYPASISVPADAVLDSGLHKTVFVERGEGLFEPREVETGWRAGGRVEITSGLEAGEKIALSGTFLIDSESRMALAAAGMGTTLVQDPVSGAMVSIAKAEKAGRKSVYNGKAYYFFSDEGKAEFDKNPEKFAKNTERDQPSEDSSAAAPSSSSQPKKR